MWLQDPRDAARRWRSLEGVVSFLSEVSLIKCSYVGRKNSRRMSKATISGITDMNRLTLDLKDESEETRGRSRVVR